MKPIVIQVLGAELTGKSQSAARRLIDDYFDKVIWSLEKDEWTRMSDAQKAEFVRMTLVDLDT